MCSNVCTQKYGTLSHQLVSFYKHLRSFSTRTFTTFQVNVIAIAEQKTTSIALQDLKLDSVTRCGWANKAIDQWRPCSEASFRQTHQHFPRFNEYNSVESFPWNKHRITSQPSFFVIAQIVAPSPRIVQTMTKKISTIATSAMIANCDGSVIRSWNSGVRSCSKKNAKCWQRCWYEDLGDCLGVWSRKSVMCTACLLIDFTTLYCS